MTAPLVLQQLTVTNHALSYNMYRLYVLDKIRKGQAAAEQGHMVPFSSCLLLLVTKDMPKGLRLAGFALWPLWISRSLTITRGTGLSLSIAAPLPISPLQGR